MTLTTYPLFEAVQLQRVFPDGKTFVDCFPKHDLEIINADYLSQKDHAGFDLKEFVLRYFELPVPHSTHYSSDTSKTVEENIEALWPVLTRNPDKEVGSLIALPYPYIVPGGRFGEIYYWDSYFTMLGLKASGKNEMIENMVKNFSYLIDTLGYIPNGNRHYFIGRSQPPFYSLMVRLLAEIKGNIILTDYLSQLEKEYNFWMKGTDELTDNKPSAYHLARMKNRDTLNRYWDNNDTARPESYREDAELAHQSGQEPGNLFRHLRAGAESGWDFSCRWFKNESSFSSIHTTDIVPVDLNCLLFHLEQMLTDAFSLKEEHTTAKHFRNLAAKERMLSSIFSGTRMPDFILIMILQLISKRPVIP